MIRYVGNLDFKEQPGAIGPVQADVGLDTLVRTFRGKTSDKYKFFSVTIGTPDRQFPALFATNIEPTDLEGGLSDFRVTYKGMLADGNMRPVQTTDSIVIKSGTVNAEYVYERLETQDGQWSYQNTISQPIPRLFPTWRERSLEIQASVSYYARATTYNYVSRNRPTGPQFKNVGVAGFSLPIEIFNVVPAGAVQAPRFRNIVYQIAVPTDPGETANDNPDYQRFLREVAEINDEPMRFKRITVTESNKNIICSNFSAEMQGVWWVCSETWEVELSPDVPDPTPTDE